MPFGDFSPGDTRVNPYSPGMAFWDFLRNPAQAYARAQTDWSAQPDWKRRQARTVVLSCVQAGSLGFLPLESMDRLMNGEGDAQDAIAVGLMFVPIAPRLRMPAMAEKAQRAVRAFRAIQKPYQWIRALRFVAKRWPLLRWPMFKLTRGIARLPGPARRAVAVMVLVLERELTLLVRSGERRGAARALAILLAEIDWDTLEATGYALADREIDRAVGMAIAFIRQQNLPEIHEISQLTEDLEPIAKAQLAELAAIAIRAGVPREIVDLGQRISDESWSSMERTLEDVLAGLERELEDLL